MMRVSDLRAIAKALAREGARVALAGGLVAAPIFYAYLKAELKSISLV